MALRWCRSWFARVAVDWPVNRPAAGRGGDAPLTDSAAPEDRGHPAPPRDARPLQASVRASQQSAHPIGAGHDAANTVSMGGLLMPTAFVLSGGASLGAVQVGMLRALLERGITPDLVVGSSVGAVNGGWLAGSPHLAGVAKLEGIWRSIGRSEIFPVNPLSGLLGFLGRRSHVVPPGPLERLLGRHLPFTRLEDARVPLHVVATEVADGVEVLLSSGDAVRAILASTAIPGVFPPVRIGDHDLMDGGVVDNNPIAHAVHLGATVVYVLPTGYSCTLPEVPRSALGMVLHALNLMTVQRLLIDIERYEHDIELHVIPPPCPLSVSPADFSRTAELIAASYTVAGDRLDVPPRLIGQRRLLGFHHHARPLAAVRRSRARRASA